MITYVAIFSSHMLVRNNKNTPLISVHYILNVKQQDSLQSQVIVTPLRFVFRGVDHSKCQGPRQQQQQQPAAPEAWILGMYVVVVALLPVCF